MRIALIAATVLLSAYAVTPSLTAQARLPVGPIPVDCNRACLEGLMN